MSIGQLIRNTTNESLPESGNLQSAGNRNWGAVTHSADGKKLFGGERGGYVYMSYDFGESWSYTPFGGANNWTSMTSSADGTKLAATVSYGGESDYPVYATGYIFTSTNSGASWTPQVDSGKRVWASICSSEDGSLLYATAGIWNNDYIYKSTDYGITWSITNSSARNWRKIFTTPDGAKVFAAAYDGAIFKSVDYGITWALITPSTSSLMWQAISASSDGNTLIAGNNDGAYISKNSGGNWTKVLTTAIANAVYAVACSQDGMKLACASYNGYIHKSINGGNTWSQMTSEGLKFWWGCAPTITSNNRLTISAVNSGLYSIAI